ncbi:23S rRNA (uracil(1939)-C(5))-methyltransferase RlmD [Aliifodinibius salicampi]|uniref:23S rRNA (Uracil(1939)-C(5))-methyltransferase RlmD n=1 Tax=Fodinibius salicampi TaxID=1920655 RepID=A0ABT3PVB4_9BACT|nr:23S rRNA (uracil(1939)-C(5))-methyltransferase RlmD [Fodinibius salicampi]MCW9711800.1 23S rRNA (uracil(1939)-C(5))-methyltransferase RlmD [Fodinibius salicampi]
MLKKGTETELTIEGVAFEGKGIAKVDGLAVFVPNTTPGDRIRARITKSKKNYREGKLLEVLEEGPRRIEPKCQHARVCGGCSWQHVDYDYQLEFKKEQVRDHMERIGGFDNIDINDTIGCDQPFYYRNKMEYSIGHRRWLSPEEINRDEYVDDHCFAAGLHVPGRFDKVLNIQDCHLQHPISYKILDFVRTWCINHDVPPYDTIDHKGYMRNVVIRNSYHTDDLMVNLVTLKDDSEIVSPLSEALVNEFPEITTVINNINDRKNPTAVGRYEKVLYGPGYITDRIGSYHFKIDANAFFQTNTRQAEELYEVAKKYADIQPDDTVYDLYCGVGTLSLFLSEKAKNLLGIELSNVAIKNARKNAESNDVDNVDFQQGDMQHVFGELITKKYGAPDCLITDPPRAGMHPDVVENINKLKVPKLVYVSCNSSTMARDLEKMSEVYDIEELQPVDMFPQTYHIETVAKLRLKN